MRICVQRPVVLRGSALVVALTGLAASAGLVVQDSPPGASSSVPVWPAAIFAVVGAVVPLLCVLMLGTLSHRPVLWVFPVAAACHAAALGGVPREAAGRVVLVWLLSISVVASVLVSCYVTLLRAEETQNRSRNRF